MLAKINNQLPASLEEIYSLIIKIALSEFNVPKTQIEKILKLTRKIIRDETLSQDLAGKLNP
jgi:hypothetical protein